jgi:hypothetical protein
MFFIFSYILHILVEEIDSADRFFSCVTFVLLGASLVPMIMLVNSTPDRIPADVVAEKQNAALEKRVDV